MFSRKAVRLVPSACSNCYFRRVANRRSMKPRKTPIGNQSRAKAPSRIRNLHDKENHMVLGVGFDLEDLEDFGRTMDQSGEAFLNRVYTEPEIEYCRSQPHAIQSYA